MREGAGRSPEPQKEASLLSFGFNATFRHYPTTSAQMSERQTPSRRRSLVRGALA